MRIFAVNAKCILSKIVCTKTKEIANLAQTIRNKRRCRRLNHNSDRNISLVRNLFSIKFSFHDIYYFKAFFYLVHAGNQREHNFKIAVNTRTVKGTQLGLQNVWILKTQSHSAQAHQRVLFFDIRQINRVNQFITTGIQGTDCNRLITHNLKH